MLRECEGDGNAGVGGWMRCGCGECRVGHVCCTRGSGIVSSAG